MVLHLYKINTLGNKGRKFRDGFFKLAGPKYTTCYGFCDYDHYICVEFRVNGQTFKRKTFPFPIKFQALHCCVVYYLLTDNVLSSALLSSGKALSSGQNPASQQFLFSKSSQ